jgi:transposase-like protein
MRCTRTRGKKGRPHDDPADPPRRRGLKFHGHGSWDHDRPPVVGVAGRESGDLRLAVARNASKAQLEPLALAATEPGARLHSDEWRGYEGLERLGRRHASVSHRPPRPVWARDDDGDGIREVHCNTIEGLWTGVRNFLRAFRGVHKRHLAAYLAVFAWGHRLKAVNDPLLRALLASTVTGT